MISYYKKGRKYSDGLEKGGVSITKKRIEFGTDG